MTYLTPKQREALLPSQNPDNTLTLAEYHARRKPPQTDKNGKPKKKKKPKVVITLYEGGVAINKAVNLVGIDPDVEESGIAVWSRERPTPRFLMLDTLPFFDLIDYVEGTYPIHNTVVRIEAGWLNKKKNFHQTEGAARRERQAADVGANHETGRKLVERFVASGYTVHLVRPSSEKWDAKEFMTYTGLPKGYNSEVRDAAKLVING